MLLKGPTGCGKTRFVEYMAWRLKRPLVTVACHDDLTAADLVGRYLIVGGQTVWMDGPLAAAVRAGAICYLDEVVEARKDTTGGDPPAGRLAPRAADREARRADSWRRRLHAGDFLQPGLPERVQGTEAEHAAALRRLRVRLSRARSSKPPLSAAKRGSAPTSPPKLVKFAAMTRNLKGSGLDEGASTRLLVHAGN